MYLEKNIHSGYIAKINMGKVIMTDEEDSKMEILTPIGIKHIGC